MLWIPSALLLAQNARVIGRIYDKSGKGIEFANIILSGSAKGTTTGSNGEFSMNVPVGTDTLIVSVMSYKNDTIIFRIKSGETYSVYRELTPKSIELQSVTIEDKQLRSTNFTRINPRLATNFTSVTGGIEGLVKSEIGVSSTNELSSQYSVRGGNYDENLVYVNDIEIYRPFLTRSGQQEGLSFLNSSMVSSVLFSAGGFEARYGDKLSSVLDIKYKTPKEFGSSFYISLLGAGLTAEGTNQDGRFTYLIGARYKTNKYLLNSMQTQGSYNPVCYDIQSLLSYRINPKLDLTLLTYYSENKYEVIPETSEIRFGTLFNPLRLTMYFDGSESDKNNGALGALTLNWKINKNFNSKWIVSAFHSNEYEAYDIFASYWITHLDNRPSSEDSVEVKELVGYGGYKTHARNSLKMNLFNVENKYSLSKNDHYFQWGLKWQSESINDNIREWYLIDSLEYTLPYNNQNPGENGNLTDLKIDWFLKSANSINSNRLTAYLQDSWQIGGDTGKVFITSGIRFQYWDFNKQFFANPRLSISYNPRWQKDIIFRISTGLYYQPAMYKELMYTGGGLNHELLAQKSFHIVAGSDWNFRAWNRPFKFISEIYYKKLWDLVPFEIDNVRIRYSGKNESHGYATGIDLKVNGEIVKGVESWASMSFMKTAEDIENDFYYNYYNQYDSLITYATFDKTVTDSSIVYPGYYPRPTDQRVNFSLAIQDYLPRYPSYRMNVTLFFGTGLPTRPPRTPVYVSQHRMPAYRRVDIGMSKQIVGDYAQKPKWKALQSFKTLEIGIEILNLLDVNNTISFNWVRDLKGNQYGAPNYLTTRQVNIKLTAEF